MMILNFVPSASKSDGGLNMYRISHVKTAANDFVFELSTTQFKFRVTTA